MPEIKSVEQICLTGILQLEDVLLPAFTLAAQIAGKSIPSLAGRRPAVFHGIGEGVKIKNENIGRN